MNSQTEKISLQGAAGAIEVQRDQPAGTPRGIAVIAHPHPLFGGTMDNKVVQTLARAFVASGWTTVRFNFRGVGASEGVHDEGRGELEDMLNVVGQLAPEGPLAIAGFSFGAFVASGAVAGLWGGRDIRQIVLVGTAAARNNVATLPAEAHERTLVVHGEADDTVALSAVMDWARPQSLPVTVIPGGGHFFHGQLPLLKGLVVRHLRADIA
ncbi:MULTISPECIES: alpha/beta family hydrolase [unclassified Variovorax]|jgi:alpha/beta superfamily hydrolase|uniref:alpha/beta hydrolase n=1 Tax=unclassified Variovorax TaxID=663243 RepID=UPI000F7D985D|nr:MULTISPECIES: alpha/beta family hydrolase [unclassified Variovorax]RSZ32327.1 alpha/beta hydrolase [Variovorax sp. 553]RSZ32510.1 alpha/beta hydrolase [Variovorax sp. 679]